MIRSQLPLWCYDRMEALFLAPSWTPSAEGGRGTAALVERNPTVVMCIDVRTILRSSRSATETGRNVSIHFDTNEIFTRCPWRSQKKNGKYFLSRNQPSRRFG